MPSSATHGAEAASLRPLLQTPFAWANAVTHFARALGAARSGNAAAARDGVERLAVLRDEFKQNRGYLLDRADGHSAHRIATAWATLAEGRAGGGPGADAVKPLTGEDATDKSAVTPGPIKPARELLGDMLLQLNQPAEALVAFEATVRKEPNRFRAVYGAARAAAAAGERQKASGYYASLLQISMGADAPTRQELAEARAATR